MIKQAESAWYDVEIIRRYRKEFYHESVQNPCKVTRGRAGWELLKLTRSLQAGQKAYVEICDQAVKQDELYNFLKSQSLNIQLP